MTSRRLSAVAFAALALGALIGCSSGAAPTPARSTAAPSVPSVPPASTGSGGEPTAEALCAAFSEALAEAAVGVAVDPPESGDVVPRPNGVYCHYSATGDPGTNVEAQLKAMTRDEFDALAENLGVTTPLAGVGEVAFQLDRSLMGNEGASVVAWSGGNGVTVVLNREGGDQPQMAAATAAIAAAALATP